MECAMQTMSAWLDSGRQAVFWDVEMVSNCLLGRSGTARTETTQSEAGRKQGLTLREQIAGS